ncbi:MAG: hypothetical protein C5B49_00380 [Bdellovibrio sp.]|nr:MAG: hypothetical protein C5B49_00380 [Bdellovibrio sp.]
MRFRCLLTILVLLKATLCFANEGHAGPGGHGVEFDEHAQQVIIYQAINFLIVVAGLIYFLRKPVREFFIERHSQYVKAAEKATEALRLAEQEHQQIKVQLSLLESTSLESVARARAEAADLRNSLIAEAENLAKRIQQEARASAILEVEKAKQTLREQMIAESTHSATTQIRQAVSREDLIRLNKEFIQNIETVHT